MAGKLTAAAEAVEELMMAQSIVSGFAEGLEKILSALKEQERLDHENDGIRAEVIGFLLKSIEAYNAKDYEGMQKFTHAAVQRLNDQGVLDFKDDRPRVDVQCELLRLQVSAVYNLDRLRKITGRIDKSRLGRT